MKLDPLVQRALAEMVGTFVFFFIGIGSIVANLSPGTGVLVPALAHGVVLAIMISSLGAISGGHFNPAVTFGLLVGRQIDVRTWITYWAAQLIGAVLAALAIKLIFPESAWNPSHIGLTNLAPGVSVGTGIALEAILTFFLVLAVYGTAVDPRHPPIGGFGIGLTIFVDILVAGGMTGGSMNPARTFGPALVSGTWDNHVVYWVGPLLGGAVAGLLYANVFLQNLAVPQAVEAPGQAARRGSRR